METIKLALIANELFKRGIKPGSWNDTSGILTESDAGEIDGFLWVMWDRMGG